MTFTTGSIPAGVQLSHQLTVLMPAGPPSSVTAPILLHGYIHGRILQSATDLSGNVLWYYDNPGRPLDAHRNRREDVRLTNATIPICTTTSCTEIDLAGNITLCKPTCTGLTSSLLYYGP